MRYQPLVKLVYHKRRLKRRAPQISQGTAKPTKRQVDPEKTQTCLRTHKAS